VPGASFDYLRILKGKLGMIGGILGHIESSCRVVGAAGYQFGVSSTP